MINSKKDSDLNVLLVAVTSICFVSLFFSLLAGASLPSLLILLFGGTISLIAIQRHLARLIALAFVDHIAFIVLPFGHRIKSFWLRNVVLKKSNWNAPQEEYSEEEILKENSLVSEPLFHVYYCEPNPAPPVSRYDLPALKQFKFRRAEELPQAQTQIREPVSFLVALRKAAPVIDQGD